MISADLMRQPISLKHVRELVSTERTTTLKWGQGKVLVCCGLEAVGGSEPEATAVFLAEGCVVCWQSSDAQRKQMLEIANGCLESPRARGFLHSRTSSLEMLWMQGEPRKVISSETLDMAEAAPGQKTHLNSNGQLMLTVDPEVRVTDQVAVSLGMAVAVRLESLEEKIERLLEEDWKALERLIKRLEDPWYLMVSLKDVSHRIFKYEHVIHKLRYELNAEARLLDSPDLLWENAMAEKLQDKVVAHFDVRRRTEILNQRLSYSLDYLHTLGEHVRHLYSVRLERMIIILITLELGVGLISLFGEQFSPHGALFLTGQKPLAPPNDAF